MREQTFDDIMRAKVEEHWGMIEKCGWEDASLENQFGLATSWDLMLDD